jgi:prolipoprotein diacylglyceryl transferase
MYPSLYYAIKDLLGVDLPFLKMVQMFGFFVAIAFLIAAYFWTKELKRKEEEGLLITSTVKILIGQRATKSELFIAGLIGFLIGYKLLYILFNFSAFTENTQGYLLSTKGNLLGGIFLAGISVFLKYREKEKTKLPTPIWTEEKIHPYQHVGNMTLIAAFAGLLGAKIFHNLENWDTFISDPIGALLSFDGLTMYGGLILASIALIYYGKKNRISIAHLIDSSAPSLMIGYAVGRIGCHLSGDGDWGINNVSPKPNWLSWAPDWLWSYDYPHNVVNYGVPILNCNADKYCNHLVPAVFPTPFYETLMCLFLFLIIWNIRKRIKTPGVLFSIYLIFNGFERFFIEKIRVNTLYHVNGLGFTQAELISSILFILGFAGIFYFRRLENKTN